MPSDPLARHGTDPLRSVFMLPQPHLLEENVSALSEARLCEESGDGESSRRAFDKAVRSAKAPLQSVPQLEQP